MPPTSKLVNRSPISRVPYDVLREIFIHCLEQYPALEDQPNTMIAPMLLVHICSAWRTVALSSATLWSHLSFCLILYSKDGINYSLISKNEIEFLQWWRKNHGSMAPFLLFYRTRNQNDEKLELDTPGGIAFLLEYISSAQYLNLCPFFWSRIQEAIAAGYRFACPNLHTLIKPASAKDDYSFYQVQALMRPHTDSVLRRFAAYSCGIRVPMQSNLQAPVYWSKLTYIFLDSIEISLEIWFYFIHAVPDLQWVYLGITTLCDVETYSNPAEPTKYTHYKLSTFFLELDVDMEEHSFSVFFSDLHLPALHTLSLSSWHEELWYNHLVIPELYAVIQSTPALTKLSLGEGFLYLLDGQYSTMNLRAIRHVDPIWRHIPHLVDLQLESPDLRYGTKREAKELVDAFFQCITFPDQIWLDLRNPACPIRTITIFNNNPPSECPAYDFKDLSMSILNEYTEKVPNVDLHVTSDSPVLKARRVWHEWGSRA